MVQAFINLGESKKTAEDHARSKEIYQQLMNGSYPIRFGRVSLMLIYRRFQILIGNPENWMRILYLMVLPSIITLIIQRNDPFTEKTILIFFLFCVQQSAAAFIMYASVPFEERTSRRRYLLKLIGVDSVSYFTCLLFADVLILTSTIPAGFLLLCLVNIGADFSFLVSDEAGVLVFSLVCMFFWELGFLA